MYKKILAQLDKASIKDTINTKGSIIEFFWHKESILDDCPIEQVYGFCLTPELEVVLVRDYDEKRFTLPGGGVNKGESPKESLIREFKEEAQFTPKNIKTLGSLEVIQKNLEGQIVDHHQQVRFICSIENMEEFIPRKDNWETEERIIVKINNLEHYLDWLSYPTGMQIFKDLIEFIVKNE